MLIPITPQAIRPPFARYSHGVVVEAGARMVFCSGQLGIGPDDAIPPDAAGQARLCFANIRAILEAAGMGVSNIVRLNAYVTAREHLAAYMQARDEFIADCDPPPASTLMIVTGFSRPEFLVEVEMLAADGATQ